MNDDTLKQDAPGVALAVELSRRADNKPATVPGYTLLKCLGEGAYGAVWLAREENTGKQVAIKFYTHHRGLDWSLLNREVEKLAVLYTSRNIVRLLGVGWDSDPPYYVMEYLENGSLASFLGDGAIPPQDAVRIARAVAQALVHAHGSGILHCDLKPANVLLDPDFEPRLCDFGQSRLSNEQSPALGTLFYMAPEQADLNAIPDARWDVYALGALLYHMLCGHAPYWSEAHEANIRAAETLDERLAIYRRILKTNERPSEHRRVSGVDRRLAEIIDRCLRIDPQKRYPNAQAVLDELQLRDRQRAQRQLMLLGAVGLVAMMVVMAPIGSKVLKKSVDKARATLVERALESDLHAARILARSLKRDLDDRQLELGEIAAKPEIREAVLKANELPWAEREKVLRATPPDSEGVPWEERDNLFLGLGNDRKAGDVIRRTFNRPLDTSWFVTNAQGRQIWRDKLSNDSDGKTYTHRDYFHGQGREYTRANVPESVKPLHEPHISLAYRSDSTKQYTVAVSVPIWDATHENVIGVLARSTQLEHLLDDYGEGIRGGVGVDRVTALVQCVEIDGEMQVRLLSHPWMIGPQMKALSDADFRKLILTKSDSEIVERLVKHRNGDVEIERIDSYIDPVGAADIDPSIQVEPASAYQEEWMAAFVPIEGTDWAAVVQERRDAALNPVVEMQSEMKRYALGGLVIGCALVGVLWYFVFRALSDRSVQIWNRRGNSSRPSDKGSTV